VEIINQILWVLVLLYVMLILAYAFGWLRIKKFIVHQNASVNQFTILIPARNESLVIKKCINDILKQKFEGQFEIIVLDDHSTDETADLVNELSILYPDKVKLVKMAEHTEAGRLKKSAITYGVNIASYPNIILTDADCVRGENWLNTIDQFIQEKDAKMVYAPVVFKSENVFEEIQALEFAGLVGIGGAAIRLKNPNMCSAANLIFKKDVFIEVGGYSGNDGIASGDDEFLLHKFFKRYPDNIHFLKNIDACVETSANASLKQLSEQRRRWVSKSTKYENRYITLILAMAWLFNFLLLLSIIINPSEGLTILLIKTFVEFFFLYLVLSFQRKLYQLRVLPIAELFHIFYVIIIGVWANIGTYKWKDRELK